MMIKNMVSQLHGFISKMMLLLEDDLNKNDFGDIDQSSSVKKNITSLMQKLVALVLQLNKLSKDESLYAEETLLSEDLKIIERFIQKYKSDKK
ncbi:MAG: hypothetical protein RLZZ59_24 [Pseudomonadota bacterium]